MPIEDIDVDEDIIMPQLTLLKALDDSMVGRHTSTQLYLLCSGRNGFSKDPYAEARTPLVQDPRTGQQYHDADPFPDSLALLTKQDKHYEGIGFNEHDIYRIPANYRRFPVVKTVRNALEMLVKGLSEQTDPDAFVKRAAFETAVINHFFEDEEAAAQLSRIVERNDAYERLVKVIDAAGDSKHKQYLQHMLQSYAAERTA